VNRALQLVPTQALPEGTSSGDGSLDGVESLLDDLDLDGEPQPTPYGHIFVVGDSADAFGAIKAGHNAYFQAEVASRNILGLISSENASREDLELQEYTPKAPMIKLSLGLKKAVYQTDGLIGWKEDQNEDLDAPLIWNYYGADTNAPGGMMR